MCPCVCDYRKKLETWESKIKTIYGNSTWDQLKTILKPELDKLQRELKVNKKELSSHMRKLISAPDDRKSAGDIGYGGVAFISVVIGLLVICDIIRLVQYILTCCKKWVTLQRPFFFIWMGQTALDVYSFRLSLDYRVSCINMCL